jgi:hexokinase
VASFLKNNGLGDGKPGTPISLGVTFPFPLKNSSINRSTIAGWSKGYDLKSGIGADFLELIEQGLAKKGVDVKGLAIINDASFHFDHPLI